MKQQTQIKSLDLSQVEKKMSAIMPMGKVKRELSFAQQLYAASKDLQECDQYSLMSAVMNVANTNLTLNPIAKEATLVARWSSAKQCKEACFMPQYIGIQKSLIAEGAVTSIITNEVRENDKFEMNLADSVTPIRHSPALKDRGKIIGFYSLATLPNGTKHPEWMDADTVNQIREKSDGYKAFKDGKVKSSPWADSEFYGEMGRKAVLKRHCKWLPRAHGATVTDTIIDLDNRDYGASMTQYGLIESLLPNALISEALYSEIESRMSDQTLTSDDASKYITVLKDNQPDAVVNGNASMKQINEAVQRKLDDPNA